MTSFCHISRAQEEPAAWAIAPLSEKNFHSIDKYYCNVDKKRHKNKQYKSTYIIRIVPYFLQYSNIMCVCNKYAKIFCIAIVVDGSGTNVVQLLAVAHTIITVIY